MNPNGRDSTALVASVLTGPGRGAISVIRVYGAGAARRVASLFRPRNGRDWANGPSDRPRFGRFGGERGDEVVVVKKSPDHVEIHGHGGPAAVQLILETLSGLGVTIAERPSPHAARWADVASRALIDAPTLRTAQILLDQADGALDRELEALPGELAIDPELAAARIEQLLACAEIGLRLIRGWRVALTGRPNVGKSRLVNALAGFDRAVVSPTAGTTRDVVRVRTAIDGWPVELSDGAGLHEPSGELDAAGIALSRRNLDAADLVLVVLDGSVPLRDEDRAILEAYPHAVLVANKADLGLAWDPSALAVSAVTGEGLPTLLGEIARRLVPSEPLPGEAIPFREDLVSTLRRMKDAIARGDLDPISWAEALKPA